MKFKQSEWLCKIISNFSEGIIMNPTKYTINKCAIVVNA